MTLFSNKKWPAKIAATIYNSPYAYIFLLALVLTQFILIVWLFFYFKKINFYTFEQTNAKVDKISAQQNLIDEKINSLQSNDMRLQAQLYRLQPSQ